MRKYKVLWFDDEHQKLELIKEEAYLENIQMIGYSNAGQGIPELRNNYRYYDAVVLDGLFLNSEKQSGTALSPTAFGEVARVLNELKAQKIILPCFVFSGQISFVKDKNDFVEVFKDTLFENGRVFDKSKDEDFKALLNEIRKAADANPERQIKVQHPQIFSIFDEGLLPDDVERQLLSLFKKPIYDDHAELKAILTNIRSIQENIFVKLEGIRVLPKGLKFNQKNTHLSGNKSPASHWAATTPEYQSVEVENLQKWVYLTCGTYIHHLDQVHYTGNIISNYAVQSLFSGLLELLLWFKKVYKENT